MTVKPSTRRAHAEVVRSDVRAIVGRLNDVLGAAVVADLAGSKDSKSSYRWARPDGTQPKDDSIRRLLFAHLQWLEISRTYGEDAARNWFISANPLLGYATPVDAIRNDRFRQTSIAAQTMLSE
ncbi:hypothetical protein F1C12_09975 [Leifsonia shinshuensis]|uniref:DUF2384 domain-containing protein n=1 Tax=Leifsonia shinshuensis TaxID=150026 RepID=A0A7G6YAA9_9MICO|nr:hypothetical protein F1C12_09975 [Leifsonia shinshuensis]